VSRAQLFLAAAALLAVTWALLALLFQLRFERWKARHAREIRQDAVDRSQAVTLGKVTEQLAPFLPEFASDPRDARFIGSPVDFVVFDGLSGDTLRQVVFVEVKTGGATLSPRERQVRDAIRDGRVEWREVRLPG